MAFYDLRCPHCHETEEYMMSAGEGDLIVECASCGGAMTRRENQDYSNKCVAISGDTCAGSENYSNYFDEGLDTFVKSRDHRKQIMKERKLTEYEPTSEGKAARRESSYILKNSKPGDKKALEAARQQSRDMDGKRKKRVIKEASEKARRLLDKA